MRFCLSVDAMPSSRLFLVNKAGIFTGVKGWTRLQIFPSSGEDGLAITILLFRLVHM